MMDGIWSSWGTSWAILIVWVGPVERWSCDGIWSWWQATGERCPITCGGLHCGLEEQLQSKRCRQFCQLVYHHILLTVYSSALKMTKCQPLKKIWELFLLKLQATPTSPDLPFQICCAIPKNLKLRRDLPDSWRADVLMCSRCVQKSLFTARSAHYLATGNLRSLCFTDINSY